MKRMHILAAPSAVVPGELKPVGYVVDIRFEGNPDACDCSCHRSGFDTHVKPCCHVCEHCGVQIKAHVLNTHQTRCAVERAAVAAHDFGALPASAFDDISHVDE